MTPSILPDKNWLMDHVPARVSDLAQQSSFEEFEPSVENPDRFSVSCPFICAYLETRSGRQLTASSTTTYEQNLSQYAAFLQDREVHLLDADLTDVIEFVEHCVDQGNRRSTIESKLTTVRELYVFIRLRTAAAEALTIDPIELERIDLAEYNVPPPIEREALTQEELRKLFDAMNSYRNRLLAVVAVETGLRNSDLRNIRVSDVDFDSGEIHVHNPKNSVPYDVPISRDLRIELQIWCDQYRDGYAPRVDSQYLFPACNGAKLETNGGLNTIIRSAAERAGIQEVLATSEVPPGQGKHSEANNNVREWHRVTVHTLRHTCFTLMKEAGVPLPYRQLVANHRDPQTTQHYSHGRGQEFASIREQFDPPR
ncbi:integrase family protein [Natronomonas moolapensis 8.8.11]|uniref:Integrase family protein n=1 Tax=Natronomonas moolapensis (strain DSM 18674 / CECT 7526 / JCM 14361 / 8.8.11) TaxID=268739 RepID=M1XQH7_NATM8|nr:site-specific integrase [Natronomonas moolapensis]CCQ36346.1 integrase family protein [Natronomonas moolapensis 8.8.11]